MLNQIRPKTQADFDALYSLIETWQAEQSCCLKHGWTGYRLAANHTLIFDKKVKLLNEVGKQRQRVKIAAVKRMRLRLLRKNCQPTVWKGYKDLVIEMLTLRTQLAREYQILYDGLVDVTVSTRDRLDVICSVKESLGIHSCEPIEYLIYLLDQEMMLLSKGIGPAHLEHLRNRIKSNLLVRVGTTGLSTTRNV